MYKALIAFTALLGLFSFNSFAASDDGSSCRQKAELAEVADVRFIGATTCADVGSVFTGNDHCQVFKSPGSTCQIDNFGVPVGLGYYFTGCLAGTDCSVAPEPLPPVVPLPLPPVLPPVAWKPVDSEELISYTGATALVNIQTELHNQRILSQNVLDNLYKVFDATNSSLANNTNNILNTKNQITNTINSRTAQISNNVSALSSQLSYTQNNLLNTLNTQFAQAAENEVFTTNKILDAIADKDDLINRLDGIDAEIAAVGNTLNYVSLAEESSVLRDQDILQGINQTRAIASNVNQITFDTRDSLSQLSGSVQSLQNTINSIADEIVPPPCGGFFNPPCAPGTGDGGDSVDLTEITTLLTQMSTDVQSIRNKIVPSNCGGFGQPSCPGSGSDPSVDFEPVITAITESNELLEDIEDEIKDVEDATQDVEDTIEDEFDDLKDALFGDGGASYYDGCQPGLNCPGDPEDYGPGLSDEGALRVANRNLQTISTKTNQVVDAVNGLNTTIDSSLKSDTAFTTPTVSDETIKASVGIDDTMDRESLFSEDVILSEASGTFSGWLGTSSCPNIPAFELPFGAQWKMDLTFFCDVLSIAGVLLMASAYISVPFIIFGGKK